MPEASVDEDSNAGGSKNEIGVSNEFLITPPPFDPGFPEYLD